MHDDVLFCNNRRPRVVDAKTSRIWSERCLAGVLLTVFISGHKTRNRHTMYEFKLFLSPM